MFKKVFILIFLLFFMLSVGVKADRLSDLQGQIAKYEEELGRLKNQSSTLNNQISQYNAQIELTSLQIEDTSERIFLLNGRLEQLNVSLKSLTEAFNSRARESYKASKINQPLLYLVSAGDLNTLISRIYYLKKVQEADQAMFQRLQKAQNTYEEEKVTQESLQKKLEAQKANLDNQKKAKANLLTITKNDEKRYQQLLSQARSEYEAIQAIIAGRGIENEVGKVKEGQKIASIIQGPSCNSSDSHLHFIVKEGSSAFNPFSYLKSIDYENCSGSNCGSSDGDAFNPSGSWNWPISPKIKFTQGYGGTWAVRNTWVGRIYSFHNGIDINSGNSEVKAVKAGTLFQGSYSGGGGCRLRYVRVAHDDSNLETLYLHINY